MTQAFHNLKTVTGVLLSPVMDYTLIREASLSLMKLFSDAVAFDEMERANESEIITDAGKAIAAKWAAFCLIDMMRTRKFILGIRDAIEEKLKMNPGRPVRVLYAGTGPFASLLTPLITVFSPLQLQMVLIEINPESIRYLKKIIEKFGMQNYIIDLLQVNAVTYSIKDCQQPDIIVSETMNNALQKEPQMSIVANLLPQCSLNPFLIPEMIKVEVCLLGNTINNPEAIIPLTTLIELDAETAVRIKNHPEDIPALSSGIIVTIPELPVNQCNQLVLCTSIRIFKLHSLGFNESGLTIPHILRITESFKKYPVRLLFKYMIESNPGFRVTEV